MKKYILLVLALCLLLTACGNGKSDTQPVTTQPTTQATQPSTEATEPSTEATEPSTEATEPSTEPSVPEESLPGYWDDAGNRVVEEFVGDLCITQEIYNPQGQLITRISNQAFGMELRRQEYEYDEAGHVITETCYAYGWEHCQKRMIYTGNNLTKLELLDYDPDTEEFVAKERFVYTYDNAGYRACETFYQAEQPKYTYFFDENGTLTGRTVYEDGVAVETEDVDNLVKLQMITGIYAPILDNDPICREFRYDGTTRITLPDIIFTDKVIDEEYFLFGALEYNDEGIDCIDEYLLDLQGRLVERTLYCDGEWCASWTYTYNEQGLLTEETEWYADYGQTIILHRYDDQGSNISTETYEDGVMIRQTLREFNQRGLVIRETNGMTGKVLEFTHNALGQVIGTTVLMDGEPVADYATEYDARGHLIIQSEWYDYEYHYNEEGYLTSVRHSYGDEVYGDVFVEYRVVYVTAAEAVELLENTNEALEWCLG